METSGHSSSLQTPESNKGENLGDSGYEGLQTTPRYFQQRVIRKTRLEFSAEKQKRIGQLTQLYRQLLPYSIPTILIFSILFGSLMGRSSEERDNLKWAHILHLSVVTCHLSDCQVRLHTVWPGQLSSSPRDLQLRHWGESWWQESCNTVLSRQNQQSQLPAGGLSGLENFYVC